MNESPKALRLHIGLFGRRNAGKSSLLNALVGQDVAIVSPTPGSTADPVEKTLEMAPLGPVVFLDTAGLDDRDASLLERLRLAVAMLHHVVEPDHAVSLHELSWECGIELGVRDRVGSA